jgi:transcription elongation factor GreB
VGSIPASRTKNWKAHNESCGLFLFSHAITAVHLMAFKQAICTLTIEHQDMSKAFTKESDGDDDDELGLPALPSGARNYMTPEGYARLRAELFSLIDDERPKVVEIVHWAASNGDRSENGDYLYGKKRLREIDRRIRFLTKRLEIAEVVDTVVHHGSDQVFFGATVTYAEASGTERTVTILGIDEADSLQAQVSWVSPIARTLLKSREGDELKLVTPAGVIDIEVLKVNYPAAL